jgi:putative FmdB family regulatory protein
MPIYEYVCSECDSKFELLRPLSQADQTALCPHCHQPARRKMSSFACYSTGNSGVPKRITGTGSACSSCTSGNCSTCAS